MDRQVAMETSDATTGMSRLPGGKLHRRVSRFSVPPDNMSTALESYINRILPLARMLTPSE
ncbi:hypothetical protein EYF80_034420 [Liparis tanakae]|uniref:Uncharacterized protein n=1 Tax=Liparis tanakae TaxID=230148 RepID=A0A4Z2GP67_9TELE|nr:hypothetical protein EYF80_034420 [Liparis tanakae]